jgi:hypothetical protein
LPPPITNTSTIFNVSPINRSVGRQVFGRQRVDLNRTSRIVKTW